VAGHLHDLVPAALTCLLRHCCPPACLQ
jgi:hypothetical protein